LYMYQYILLPLLELWQGHRDHDRMVVGFTTTCAIKVYHH
jgi:hypothetical protein